MLFLLHGSLREVQVPLPKSCVSLSLSFLSLSFALPHTKEIELYFWKFGIFYQYSEDVLEKLFYMQMYF